MHELNKEAKSFLPNIISREQSKDTGMAMVLICLLIWYFGNFESFFGLSLVLLIINMIIPQVYRPVAKLWLGFSNLMGAIMSKVLLTILFFVLVTPMGILRRIIGNDSTQIKKWKKDRSSVFQVRNHTYQPRDIEKPY
jgi:hypothetical protein